MNIYIQEKPAELIDDITPDVALDCSLMTHKEILTSIAGACYLSPSKSETILQLAERISRAIPKRRILILFADRAPAKLAYSLMLLDAGGHVIHVHAKRATGIVRTLKANGARIHYKGGFHFNYAFQMLVLLLAISLTLALPRLLKAQGIETGVVGFIIFYLLRRYLWRATWMIRKG